MQGLRVFFCGPLAHAPLRRIVLGREAAGRPARLSGLRLAGSAADEAPGIVAAPGGGIDGVLVEDVSAEEARRVEFHEGVHGRGPEEHVVDTGQGRFAVRLHRGAVGPASDAADWPAADWAREWGPVMAEAAADILAQAGTRSAADLRRRRTQILVRASTRVRARSGPAPTALRRTAAEDDVELVRLATPYAHFFSVEEYDLRYRRFDGRMSAVVNRAVFVSGDAATVLPYDPVRDRVLLIEQFRPGPLARGDRAPWMLEPVAGRIDPGETPEQAARREAVEEAGVAVGALHRVAAYYPSPGAKMEYLFSFVGIADLPDRLGGAIAGVADENEDIRVHLVSFDDLMALVASGEAENGPLLVSAMWLAAHRPGLRSKP